MDGGGSEPPTTPPNFIKPTPASHPVIIESYTRDPNSNPEDHDTIEGTSGDEGSVVSPSGSSSDSNMDQSFVDPCVINRGPRLHSTSSFLYPIQCPEVLANNLPVHPSTHFVRREDCTAVRIQEYEQRLRETRESIYDLVNYIPIHQSYHRISESARENAFGTICKAAERNPHISFLSPENIARTKALCAVRMENSFDYILDLERRLAIFRQLEVRITAELSAMRFGHNYARQHPSDEFVIFVMEEGNVLQRTNPFQPSRFSGPNIEVPEMPEDHFPTPAPGTPRRLPRSNVHTNQLAEPSPPHFDVIHIEHTFQLINCFNKNRNVLIVFPGDSDTFRSLTRTMDNNLIIIHDSIKRYYTSGRFEPQLKNISSEYFKFTTQLRLSHIDFKFKNDYIMELDDYIRHQLDGNMRWFYDTWYCLEDLKMKISQMFQKLYSTKI